MKFNVKILFHHHHTQCIPLIEKLWIGSGEGQTTATNTHKGERDQRIPPARDDKVTELHGIDNLNNR